jgi:hypothetical protein
MSKKTSATLRRKNGRAGAAQDQRKVIAETIAELDLIKPRSVKAARAISLFKSWLADDSGYDEAVWPRLKKSLQQERASVGARRLFDA